MFLAYQLPLNYFDVLLSLPPEPLTIIIINNKICENKVLCER